MRVFLIVIDGFGIGALPDAAHFGDEGSDTYGNIVAQTGLRLQNFALLGLNNIEGIGVSAGKVAEPVGAYGRMAEKTNAKDTTAGHYEIAGLVLERPYRVFPGGFPADIVVAVEQAAGVRFIGNEVASGTEIIQRLGLQHLRTGCPILYTSQDSVMQIAADVSVMPLEQLYAVCKAARGVMMGDRAVGRVIARPFIHIENKFVRTKDRRDYALAPPGETVLDRLSASNVPVIGVGKIEDIFCGRGIVQAIHTGSNAEGLDAVEELEEDLQGSGLVFVNLVDTDMLYGHRNDVYGYADALRMIEARLPRIMKKLQKDDVLILTADHGCDPTTPSTDHSREYVPLLIYGERICAKSLGTLHGFDHIARFLEGLFGLKADEVILNQILRR